MNGITARAGRAEPLTHSDHQLAPSICGIGHLTKDALRVAGYTVKESTATHGGIGPRLEVAGRLPLRRVVTASEQAS